MSGPAVIFSIIAIIKNYYYRSVYNIMMKLYILLYMTLYQLAESGGSPGGGGGGFTCGADSVVGGAT